MHGKDVEDTKQIRKGRITKRRYSETLTEQGGPREAGGNQRNKLPRRQTALRVRQESGKQRVNKEAVCWTAGQTGRQADTLASKQSERQAARDNGGDRQADGQAEVRVGVRASSGTKATI